MVTEAYHILVQETQSVMKHFNLTEEDSYRFSSKGKDDMMCYYLDDKLVLSVEYAKLYGGKGFCGSYEVPVKIKRHY